ncbi:MAG: hypothetical protein ACJAYP_000223 [Flavobacterium sp.]|jgi:hypothetical protein
MKISFLNNKLLGSVFTAIEVCVSNNEYSYIITIVKKAKEGFSIIDSITQSSLDIDYLKKINAPIFLNINTDKVLCKTIDGIERNDLIAVKKKFPSINIDEFNYDLWHHNNKTMLAIARKDYCNNIISQLEPIKGLLFQVNIGIIALKNIVNYFPKEINEISLNHNHLDLLEFNLINKPIEKATYSINSIELTSQNIVNFSSVLNLNFESNDLGSVKILNKGIKNDYFQNMFFKKTGIFFVYFILGVLLINYLLFSYYFNQYNELSIIKENVEIQENQLKKIKKEVVEKEQILKGFNSSDNKKASFIINEVTKNIPSTIILDKLHFNPLLKKGQDLVLDTYEDQIILISGITNNEIYFSDWIQNISNSDIVKEVFVINYGKKESEKTEFTLKIVLNEIK